MSLANFKNCKTCKTVFKTSPHNSTFCPRCAKKNDAEFSKIRDLLVHHDKLSPIEISHLTDLPLSTVLHFVKTGRLGEPDPLPTAALSRHKAQFHTND